MTIYYPVTNLTVENTIVSSKSILQNTSISIKFIAVYLTMPSYKKAVLQAHNFELFDLTWLLKDLQLDSIKTPKYLSLLLPYLTDFSDQTLVVDPRTLFYEDVSKLFEKDFDYIAAAPAINFLQSSENAHPYFSNNYQLFSTHLLAVKTMSKLDADYFLFKSSIDTNYDNTTVLAWLNAMYFNRWLELDFSWNVKTIDAIFTDCFMEASDEQLDFIAKAKLNPACVSYYKLNPDNDKLSFEAAQKYQRLLKDLNLT